MMKYTQKRINSTDCHIFAASPAEGHFTANRSYDVQNTKDFHHAWFERELEEEPFAIINGPYFDMNTGQVVGGMYVDSGFTVSPFLSDRKFVTMVWENGLMSLDEAYSIDVLKAKYPEMSIAVQLGDPLVKDSVIYKGDGYFDHSFGNAPRSFVGQLETGEIVMFATDGRTGSDKGFTRDSLAQVALDMGCKTAVMCDGGGSSSIVIQDQVVNDNEERKVPAVFMFYAAPDSEVQWINEISNELPTYQEFLELEISDGIKWKDLVNGVGQINLTPDIWEWTDFSISYDRLLSKYFFPNFTFKEYACNDDDQILIDEESYNHGLRVQKMRYDLDFPFKIGSWIRTGRYNKAVGGVPLSTHFKRIATDIDTTDKSKQNKIKAYWKEKQYGGTGLYTWGNHVDSRGYFKEWWN